ncbi:Maf family protein [Roseibacillus ishigakijimensis]|uniref:dTTP/UTP pyrophosphatase n=1 Tax=Roseibacillus ishigakijimensis TaxID=454146 RepID=A0A934RQQ2_9BACT|nr:Maf family protein [Roseibacillus ishigakijimensis]MBK1832791.1 septum formation protein Maf [Roseibacillus ishigakijimensis]
MKLVLASGSPRRRELLAREGVTFTVFPSPVEEHAPGALPPVELARANALLKARDIFAGERSAVVLGSDTVVVVDDRTLGKPRDLAQGAEMLRLLAGRWHEVVTGVALLSPQGEEVFHETTRVRFKELSDEEIADYQARVEVLDKAGGYAIQDGGERIIAEVVGCRDNVMGLPVSRVVEELQKFAQ